MNEFKRRASTSRLKIKSSLKIRVTEIFESIAKKLELKPKEVTFIGIHNRRGAEFVQELKDAIKNVLAPYLCASDQSDQIGRFLNFLGTNFLQHFGHFEIRHFSSKNSVATICATYC